MRLSPAAELALQGIIVLAQKAGQGPVNLAKICSYRELPKQYLAKIFATLARADLVKPVRGKRGGYLLSREPQQITVLEVIEAVEGPLALNSCQHQPPKCDDLQCRLRSVWTELQTAIRTRLGSITLADCLAPAP